MRIRKRFSKRRYTRFNKRYLRRRGRFSRIRRG
nr:MAG TPA: hypothetical protein [Microviridae sp.]